MGRPERAYYTPALFSLTSTNCGGEYTPTVLLPLSQYSSKQRLFLLFNFQKCVHIERALSLKKSTSRISPLKISVLGFDQNNFLVTKTVFYTFLFMQSNIKSETLLNLSFTFPLIFFKLSGACPHKSPFHNVHVLGCYVLNWVDRIAKVAHLVLQQRSWSCWCIV